MDFDAAVEEADKTQKTVRKKKRNSVTEGGEPQTAAEMPEETEKSVGFYRRKCRSERSKLSKKRWSDR